MNSPISPEQAGVIASQNCGSGDAELQAADRINAIALADYHDEVRGELHVKLMAARQAAPAVSGELLPVVLSSGGGRSNEQRR